MNNTSFMKWNEIFYLCIKNIIKLLSVLSFCQEYIIKSIPLIK